MSINKISARRRFWLFSTAKIKLLPCVNFVGSNSSCEKTRQKKASFRNEKLDIISHIPSSFISKRKKSIKPIEHKLKHPGLTASNSSARLTALSKVLEDFIMENSRRNNESSVASSSLASRTCTKPLSIVGVIWDYIKAYFFKNSQRVIEYEHSVICTWSEKRSGQYRI